MQRRGVFICAALLLVVLASFAQNTDTHGNSGGALEHILHSIENIVRLVYLPYHKSAMCTLCSTSLNPMSGVVVLALAVSGIALAVVFMLARVVEASAVEAWVKVELTELAVTFLIFIVFSVLLKIACAVPIDVFFPQLAHKPGFSGKNMFETANLLLYNFAVTSEVVLVEQFLLGKFVVWTCGQVLHGLPMGMGTTASVLKGFLPIANAMFQVTIVTTAVSIITALGQMHVLNFMEVLLIKYLLPIGFVARAFTFTRRFGGAVIALGIVFLFFYPFLVVLFYQTYELSDMSAWTAIKTWWHFVGNTDLGYWILLSDSANVPFAHLTAAMFREIARLTVAVTLAFIPPVSLVFIGGVLVPVLFSVVLVTGTKELSKAIGEQLDVTNLTRMI